MGLGGWIQGVTGMIGVIGMIGMGSSRGRYGDRDIMGRYSAVKQNEAKSLVAVLESRCSIRLPRPTINHVYSYLKTITILNQDTPFPSPLCLDITCDQNIQSLVPQAVLQISFLRLRTNTCHADHRHLLFSSCVHRHSLGQNRGS